MVVHGSVEDIEDMKIKFYPKLIYFIIFSFSVGYRASPLFCKQHAGTMTDDSSKHDTNLGEVDIPRADALLQGKLSLGIETPIDKRSAVNIDSVALSVSK